MKKHLLFFLIICTINLFSQWINLNPYPTGNTTYVGSAGGANHYLTVSGQGEAIFTTNGGNTWNIVFLPLDGIYRSSYFLNENVGWVAGAIGSGQTRIFKTTDGGFNWIHQPNAPDTTKYDVFFISESVGWIVGFNGFIIKTTDGGNSWFSQSNTAVTSRTLYGVYATDVNNVYIAGGTDALIRSTDGGTTWISTPQLFSTITDYRGVYFPSTGTGLKGFVVGSRNRIIKTTNGGAAWTSVYDPGGTTNQLWAIDFTSDGQIGLACGGASTVLRTTNGGDTWTPVTGFASGITFYSIRFGSDNIAYVSGSSGYIYKSTDAGVTWNLSGYRFTGSRIRDISFADNLNGYVVGTGFAARSTDGGYTWSPQTVPFTGDINEVISTSPNFAVAGCDGGNIIRTTNGGANWELVATGITGTNSDILAIDFINDNQGWVAAYNGIVAKTTNGGASWNIISTISGSNPWDMDFVDELYGWVVGTNERIFGTTDGGLTWTQQLAVGGLGTYGVGFADAMHGVAGGTGGNTYYTTNGGLNWFAASVPPQNTVWGIGYVKSPLGHLIAMTACASGYVYKSLDSGKTWQQEPRYTISTMDDMCFSDAAHAWFVGNSGLVLGYYEPANIPVELSSFNAIVSKQNINLSWTTTTEKNNFGFEIERTKSSQNNDWQKIGFVEGIGTTTEKQNYSYTDKNLPEGKYFYRLKQIDYDGKFEYSNIVEVDVLQSIEFALYQNYPNPFNPVTTINYSLPAENLVRITIYNLLGEKVSQLVNEVKPAGFHSVEFNSTNFPSGLYLYKLETENFNSVKKMIILK